MTKPIRLMIIDDDPDVASEAVRELERTGREVKVRFVGRMDELSCELGNYAPDVIVANPAISPDGTRSIVDLVWNRCSGVPVILLSDREDEEAVVEAMRAGADDYVFRGRIGRLADAVNRGFEGAADRKRRDLAKVSEARHRYFLDQTMEGFYRLDFDPPIPVGLPEDEMIARMYESGLIVECNQVYAETYGYATPEAMAGARLVDLHGGPDVPEENLEAMREFVRAGLRHIGVATVEVGADGEDVWLLNNSVGIVEDGSYVCCWGTQRDITEQRRAEELVVESREQLRALAANSRRVQEEERRQCARLIHDELGQMLTGLKMEIRWMEDRLSHPELPGEFNPLLDRIVAASELIDQTTATVQRIAMELRPGTLDQLSLEEALTAATRRFGERSGITVEFLPAENVPRIPQEIANDLYYICQEALTNVARHSKAKSVEIRLWAEDGEIVLEICDDGIGIDHARMGSRRSLGILGMEERAFQCGGTVDILCREPAGTKVTARVSLSGDTPKGKG